MKARQRVKPDWKWGTSDGKQEAGSDVGPATYVPGKAGMAGGS
jgi:hypothetical protein